MYLSLGAAVGYLAGEYLTAVEDDPRGTVIETGDAIGKHSQSAI